MMPCNDTRGISPQMATIFGLSMFPGRVSIGRGRERVSETLNAFKLVQIEFTMYTTSSDLLLLMAFGSLLVH